MSVSIAAMRLRRFTVVTRTTPMRSVSAASAIHTSPAATASESPSAAVVDSDRVALEFADLPTTRGGAAHGVQELRCNNDHSGGRAESSLV